MKSGYRPRPSRDDLSRPSPPPQPRRRRAGRPPGAFREGGRGTGVGARAVVLVLFGFILSGILGAGAYFAPSLVAAFSQTGIQSVVGSVAGPPPPGAPLTVLLLGSDDDTKFDPQHVLTQSMILLRVDPQQKTVVGSRTIDVSASQVC